MNTNNSDGLIYKIAAIAVFVTVAILVILMVSNPSGCSGTDGAPYITEAADDRHSSVPQTEDTWNILYVPQVPDTQVQTDTEASVPTTDTEAADVPVTASPITDVPETTVSSAPPTVSTPVSVPTTTTPKEWGEFLAGYPDTVLSQSDDAGQEYIDKLTFLGDSTTYGLRAYKMLSGGRQTTQVWTPRNGTLTLYQASFITVVYPETDEELTIKQAVEKKQPEYLVITLGVNGVATMDEEYFKSEYKKVIETVHEASPDTKIICQSIFPVARTYEKLHSINNDKIMAANHWIVEVAAETGVKFLDTYSVLCDEEGWLPESYHNGDGMHLNSTSFTLEINNIRTHAYSE